MSSFAFWTFVVFIATGAVSTALNLHVNGWGYWAIFGLVFIANMLGFAEGMSKANKL